MKLRRGMTLFELLLAVALSAMLLAALVGLLQGTSRQVKLASNFETPAWKSNVIKLIKADMQSAESIWQADGRVLMRSSPPPYYETSGVQIIAFECVRLGDQSPALLRIQGKRKDVLALGPTRLKIERLDSDGIPQPLPDQPGPPNRQFRIWVFERDQEQASIETTVTL
ncbi:MAG: prepilin-type N-terminal cleavage/methylation domain-containing protein [Planctomycetota bacterium]